MDEFELNCYFYYQNKSNTWMHEWSIDKYQDDEINVDLCTFGFDNEALSVDRYALYDGSMSQCFHF